MRILFCSHPLDRRQPDPGFEAEVQAAEDAGLTWSLFSYEALVSENDAFRAVRHVEGGSGNETCVYRGWMMRPSAYERLYQALEARGLQLVNTPEAYRHCHHLPESYAVLSAHAPRTTWIPLARGHVDDRDLKSAVEPFGSHPVVLKDYVKSCKHLWHEACYIPDASDAAAVQRVVQRFLDEVGDDLNEGLVFREFLDLESVGRHPITGMPLSHEIRLFFMDGEVRARFRYWPECTYTPLDPPAALLEVGSRVSSRFFAMDVARCQDGTWVIIELGDGQVSGLQEEPPLPLFSALQACFG